MKPITHPLAVAHLMAMRAHVLGDGDEGAVATALAWADAGCPLYADLTPLPAPALGMRVWTVHNVESASGAMSRRTEAFSIAEMSDGDEWTAWTAPAYIDLITDYRTGEVLWRRQ